MANTADIESINQLLGSWETLSSLPIEKVNPKWLKTEPDLYVTKWWDYKMLHPTLATYLYAESFKEAVKHAITIRKDLYIGLNFKGLKEKDVFDNKPVTITGLWKGRQMADELGIPYRFYCFSAFKFAETMNRKYLPTAHNMYSTSRWEGTEENMVEWIERKWKEKSVVHIATDDFYLVDNYVGHEYQRQYQLYLINSIKNHPARDFFLSDLIYDRKILLKSLAAKVFGEKDVERTRRYSDSDLHPCED